MKLELEGLRKDVESKDKTISEIKTKVIKWHKGELTLQKTQQKT